VANYEKAYEKVEDEEALSYIKLINLNTKVRSRVLECCQRVENVLSNFAVRAAARVSTHVF